MVKDAIIQVFDDNDHAEVKRLRGQGLAYNIANTLVFLSYKDDVSSLEISHSSGLQWDAVEKALYWLRLNNYVTTRYEHRPPPAPPMAFNTLVETPENIVKDVNERKQKREKWESFVID